MLLRAFEPGDAGRLAQIFDDPDEGLARNGPGRRTIPGMRLWVAALRDGEDAGELWARAIVDDRPADGVGLCGGIMISAIDRAHSLGWVSYWLAPEARGRSLASAALRAAVAVGHDRLGIYRLELGYRVDNPASARVVAAAGFTVEGRQRGKLSYGGRRFDTEECAHLAGDRRP
ncbi:GNAT family N-acetyltransferase [Brevibacterium sp. 5221]|uniref:GNAT family N-acetyltransferase n=1 Tax=Brevibacterium rongguiense TaxID=2695267 RepID=A0A6N9H8A2_9MICO|nr:MULTISPECIES: GNAT family protein [Brevibacterium]MYM20036.1 GNAT family N-acetyltransferase [Brevibacterium rongguiense]WAL41239.1 GNAT family protein [Brevibacterium sp. BRM-1]